MKDKDIIKNYHYEKLNKKHDLSRFSCGVKDLDDFLKDDALDQQEKNLNVTYLAIHEDEIIGYASLLADKIECKKIDKSLKTEYKDYPAIKIGRLAVDEKYKGLGIGNEILASICRLIEEISKEIGVSFITIDAYCNARKFYLKNSFTQKRIHNPEKLKRKAQRDETTSIFMYKNIKKIKIT